MTRFLEEFENNLEREVIVVIILKTIGFKFILFSLSLKPLFLNSYRKWVDI